MRCVREKVPKVKADKSELIVLYGEERLECEISVDETRFEQVSELKYFGYVLDERNTDVAECRKVSSGWKIAVAIRSLIKVMGP